ncbi:squalene/phytoene synthase family protein [Loktanella sp. SALINAS62]|uniref:phytoene/squalene synthase family protein n=1 Tax=Loktanella sp. SALINAS62 TaxID=2706124 RepID=UPI00201385D1|nr:squalene/phytoene synthase family protein [Loktanella sp. SALINAS62]
MAYHARSFSPGARLLPRHDRRRVARLYVLCRTVDDIADEIGGSVGQRQLQDLQRDLSSDNPQDELARDARDLFRGRPAGHKAFAQLVDTAAHDTGAVSIQDMPALDAYCMGVAGTVGIMICSIFDVDAVHHQKAADLGKAMQLTNICRDVREDAANGRRYLPFTLCPHSPDDIVAGTPDAIAAAEYAMADLLDRADELYLSGLSGLGAVPLRLRLAVASAAAMYQAIGTRLRTRGYHPLGGREIVPREHKAMLAIRAIASELTQMRNRHDGSNRVQA